MRIGLSLAAVACVALGAAAGGCGPNAEQVAMAKALSARADRQADFNASAKFFHRYVAREDKDYVMWAMDYSSLCLMGGDYDAARKELLRCHADIEKHQDTDKEQAAAISDESLKVFKGEPFERAMVCTYLGLLHYMNGDYNNARIFCARANMADATTADNMARYRDDFRLAHYLLARSYMKLGQADNARIAFGKSIGHIPRANEQGELRALQRHQAAAREKRIRLEKASYANATTAEPPVAGAADMSASPALDKMPAALPQADKGPNPVIAKAETLEGFASVDFQKQVNLILVVETGLGPVKTLIGENQFMDRIDRAGYPERRGMVYLDGHNAGTAFRMLDTFHQADTRGTTEKDAAQTAKGIAQSVLSRLPYVSYAAAYWNVQADWRYWRLLPGEVHVYAAKVRPGLYTVCVRSFDSNGMLLPRYTLTRYYIPVRAGQENVYLLHTHPEADNTYVAPAK